MGALEGKLAFITGAGRGQGRHALRLADVSHPGRDDARAPFAGLNLLTDVPWIEPSDVSEAVARLYSDAARYITGKALPIDAGNTAKKG